MNESIIKRAWAKAKNKDAKYQEKVLREALKVVSAYPLHVFPLCIAFMMGGFYLMLINFKSIGMLLILLGPFIFMVWSVYFLVLKNNFEKTYLGGKND